MVLTTTPTRNLPRSHCGRAGGPVAQQAQPEGEEHEALDEPEDQQQGIRRVGRKAAQGQGDERDERGADQQEGRTAEAGLGDAHGFREVAPAARARAARRRAARARRMSDGFAPRSRRRDDGQRDRRGQQDPEREPGPERRGHDHRERDECAEADERVGVWLPTANRRGGDGDAEQRRRDREQIARRREAVNRHGHRLPGFTAYALDDVDGEQQRDPGRDPDDHRLRGRAHRRGARRVEHGDRRQAALRPHVRSSTCAISSVDAALDLDLEEPGALLLETRQARDVLVDGRDLGVDRLERRAVLVGIGRKPRAPDLEREPVATRSAMPATPDCSLPVNTPCLRS